MTLNVTDTGWSETAGSSQSGRPRGTKIKSQLGQRHIVLDLLLSKRLARRSDVLFSCLWLCNTLLAKDARVPSVLHLRRNARSLRQAAKLVQLRFGETLLAEHVGLEPPREIFGSLILHVRTRGHSENVVELFKRSLLRLREPQEAVTLSVTSLFDYGPRLTS